jgi:hypothetical protein
MTITNLREFRESYSSIYATPSTEEDLWEQVESWAESLVDEGYDLSEYTWEEIYEAYIEEAAPQGDSGSRIGRGLSGALRDLPSALQGQLTGKSNPALQRQMQRGRNLIPLITRGKLPGGGKGNGVSAKVAPTVKPSAPKPLIDKSGRNVFDGTATTRPQPSATTRPQPSATTRPTTSPTPPSPRPTVPAAISPKVAPTPGSSSSARANYSPANASTPQKIQGGLQIYKAQVKAGDVKGAEATGKSTWALANTTLANKKTTPNPAMMKKENFSWGSTSKIAGEFEELYKAVYEAKKVDQDVDGDNDFADVRIARMVASGVPKEEAIRRVKSKSYNEEAELDEARTAVASPGDGPGKRYKGKHGQSDKEYMAGRSDAGKRISGDDKTGPNYYTKGRSRGATPDAPTKPGAKPANTPKLSSSEREYNKYRHSDTMKGIKKGYLKVGGEKGLPEDFELWVNGLIEEGYDLSDYTWNEVYAIYEELTLEEETAKEKEARIAARRARVREMEQAGEVMTSARRTREKAKQRKEEKRADELEKAANAAINQVRGSSGRVSQKPMGSEPPEAKPAAPEATRRLRTGLRKDNLGTAADDILRKIRNEQFTSWVDELLDEGYDLTDWSEEELLSLYEQIIESN